MFRTSTGSIGTMLYGTERKSSYARSRASMSRRPSINDQKLKEIRIELDHAKMQLMVEEDRVNELEKNLSSLVSEKYRSDSALISRLRESLDHLRLQLALLTESKQQLASATAAEMVRLRDVIRLLTDQIFELTHEEPTIRTFSDVKSLEEAKQQHKKKNRNDENNDPLTDGLDKEDEEKAIIDNTFDRTTPGQGSQKTTRKNTTKNQLFRPKHIEQHSFPYVNNRAIHLITFKQGDQQTYPQAYSTVHLLYTGYIYASPNPNSQEPTDREDRVPSNWQRFTDPSTTDTISATPLGIGQNISGIEHAVMRMSVGQRARVYVPSRLAYGSYGAKELIPPNADLIFDLHLIAIHSPLNNDEANVAMLKEPNSESENEHVENDENDNIMNNLSNGVNSYDNVSNQPFAASEKFITQEIHEQNRKPLENLLAEDNNGHSLLDEPTEEL